MFVTSNCFTLCGRLLLAVLLLTLAGVKPATALPLSRDAFESLLQPAAPVRDSHPFSPAAGFRVPNPSPPAVPTPVPVANPAPPRPLAPSFDFSASGQIPDSGNELLMAAGQPLPGSILPRKRIVAFYGNPMSRRMGVLGEFNKTELLSRLRQEVADWQAADPSTEVQPALHLIAVVAQATPGRAGKYRKLMTDALVKEVYSWAREAGALLFIDIQPGQEDIRKILPRFEWILKNPDVHLGIDPEFNLAGSDAIPGTRIGSFDAVDINAVSAWLADLVERYHLPPKVLTVHRFTRGSVTNADKIELRPEVQIVMHMDGWGSPAFKRATYRDTVAAEPVQYTGFKLFFHNDTKGGEPLMTPREVLSLHPQPMYIQYQ